MLVVLVDVENDDHPWLGAVERTLDELERRGVAMLRYHFKHRPSELFHVRGSRNTTLDAVCRRHANALLLVASRRLDPRTLDNRPADWLGLLPTFPCCAWLDLDPRAPDARRAARIAEVERSGLTRFPFTAAGWFAVARAFTGVQSSPPLQWPVLPERRSVESALSAWALVAALVPDATWDQLEAVRRDPRFFEIQPILTEPYHLQLLLDWVEDYTGVEAVSGDGRTLVLPNDVEKRMVFEERARDTEGPPEPLEERGRDFWLEMLAYENPEGEWLRLRVELKRAGHRMALDPSTSLEELRQFEGTPIEELALEVLRPEVERQRLGKPMRGRVASDRLYDCYEDMTASSDSIEVKQLFRQFVRVMPRALMLAAFGTMLLAVLGEVIAVHFDLANSARANVQQPAPAK